MSRNEVIIEEGNYDNVDGTVFSTCDFCADETNVHIVRNKGIAIKLCTNCAIEIGDNEHELEKLRNEKCGKRRRGSHLRDE